MTTTKVNLANTVEGILPVANGGTGTSTGVAPGGSTTQVQFNNAGAFGGSANFVFDGTNVGINTTSPGVKLGVVDTSAGSATFPVSVGNRGTTVGTQVNLALQTYDAGSAGITNAIGSVTTSASSGAGSADMVFLTTASATRAERMRIASTGALGFAGANYGSSGQVLTSNGSGSAPSWATAGGGVTSLNGQTGAITNTSFGAIGSYLAAIQLNVSNGTISENTTHAGSNLRRPANTNPRNTPFAQANSNDSVSFSVTGTWRALGFSRNSDDCGVYSAYPNLYVRIS